MIRAYHILAVTAGLILTITLPHVDASAESPTATGTVVGVTATELYLDVGSDEGARVGDSARITAKIPGRSKQPANVLQVELVDVWADGARARLEIDQRFPSVGDAAVVVIPRSRVPTKAQQPHPLPPLEDAQIVSARWRGVDLSRAKLVIFKDRANHLPKSPQDAEIGVHGVLGLQGVALWNPLSKLALYNQLSLRSDLSVTGLNGPWGGEFDYSHRLRLRYDIASDLGARRFSRSRSLARIYRMRLGFNVGQLRAEVGRTDASPVPDAGMIDGVSVRHKVAKGVEVGAWAGARPSIDDLRPQSTSLGFGVHGGLRRTLDAAHGRTLAVDAGLHGSTYHGRLDRRAAAIAASVAEPGRWLRGQLVLDIHRPEVDPTRPVIEPTNAFLDAGTRMGKHIRANVRVDHVRSLRTAEALDVVPTGYLSTVAFTSIRAGATWRLRRGLSVAGRSGWRFAAEGASSLWSSAAIRASGIWLGEDHGSIAVDGSLGRNLDGAAFRARYSLPLLRNLDVAAGYRLYGYRYGSENARLWMHQPSISVEGTLPASLYASLDIDGYLGSEELGIGALASLTRRF